jgi:hypothetical protein
MLTRRKSPPSDIITSKSMLTMDCLRIHAQQRNNKRKAALVASLGAAFRVWQGLELGRKDALA